MKNHQFLKCNSKGAIQKIVKYYSEKAQQEFWENPKYNLIFSWLSKLTVSFHCMKETYVAHLELIVYMLHQGVRYEFWEDGILKELGII